MTLQSKELFVPIELAPTVGTASEERSKEELAKLKGDLERQQKLSLQIIVGVVIAFIFTIGLVAIEIILFHTRSDKDCLNLQSQYLQEVKELREKNYQSELRLQRELDELKPKIPPSAPPKQ